MTTGNGVIAADPYVVPDAVPDAGPVVAGELHTTITAALSSPGAGTPAQVDIGAGFTTVNAETYNGAIPGPTLKLNKDDTVIVRLVNDLPYPTGIHWHGIELQNSADGTPVTQDGAAVGPFATPPMSPLSPSGGTYLYKFKVPRPGLYWYHPHHHHSTNRVLRGLYGMIVVTDPLEPTLVGGVLPAAADTYQLVLSDITVCKMHGSNPNRTYDDPLAPPPGFIPAEWLSGANSQTGPAPEQLCESAPLNEDGTLGTPGTPGAPAFAEGDVPNIQKKVQMPGQRTVEGQTVLTNGVNVGGRQGSPNLENGAPGPGVVAAGAHRLPVAPGQGLRLQIVNCATIRYFRLILTTAAGARVPLVRIGGEGGLLDEAVLEGDPVGAPAGSFVHKYASGEILLPPATRADVVAAIPPLPDVADGDVLTLWTQDYDRTGGGFSEIPTVPVMHLEVDVALPPVPTYTLNPGTTLRPGGDLVKLLDPVTGALLNPAAAPVGDFPSLKLGLASEDIQLTAGGGDAGIDFTKGEFPPVPPSDFYTSALHLDSSRYAKQGDILELTVTNLTNAHHPFHLHGFSMQPKSLEPKPFAPAGLGTFNWGYNEFRDTIDVPRDYTLRFRVRIDDHEFADGSSGGALGRWLFHCHIFFHAHSGMISELVITDPDGSEKPNVDVGGSWTYTAPGGKATRRGTFSHPDGDAVTLSASDGVFTAVSPGTPASPGTWAWELDSTGEPNGIRYVYITAEDAAGRKDQTVFRLKIGPPDDGSDTGDPHIHTVDGKTYHFQTVGEFTLLRDREGMEIQARQTPVETANPFPDSYSGLTSCVSVNTAVAARVGAHRIAYQPIEEHGRHRLQFFVDGKPAQLSTEGIDLEGHRVSAFDAGGETGLRVDYAHNAVLTVTPHFWNSNKIWYMNVSVSHTQGDEGIMGPIPDSSWLPTLPGGATVGPKPESLHDRYIALYKTFANAWRVTDETSLFVYAPGTSTATFTDEDWPTEKPPCKMKPQFEVPGLPTPVNIPVEEAERICQRVTMDDLHGDCVFDVFTTGDKTFAEGYLVAQDLRLHGSTVQIVGDQAETRPGEPLVVTAIVIPMSSGRPTPTGSVTFLVDGIAVGPPVKLDEKGRASHTLDRLEVGAHKIRAAYTSDDGKDSYHPSSSPNLLHTVEKDAGPTREWSFGSWWIWICIILVLIAIAAYAFIVY